MSKRKNVDFVDAKVEKKELSEFSAKSMIDGSWLTLDTIAKRLPFILFCVLLMLLYIANRYHAEHVIRQTLDMKKEIKNLRAEEITASYELINLNRPSEVQAIVEAKGLGLKFHKNTPKIIRIR